MLSAKQGLVLGGADVVMMGFPGRHLADGAGGEAGAAIEAESEEVFDGVNGFERALEVGHGGVPLGDWTQTEGALVVPICATARGLENGVLFFVGIVCFGLFIGYMVREMKGV